MQPKPIKSQYKLLLMLLAAICLCAVFFLLAKLGIGIPCLFYQVTGLKCPGCGNSRAAMALLRLDFAAAFSYNYLFPLEFFYLFWVFFYCCRSVIKTGKLQYKPPFLWLDIGILAAVMIWWVVRNLLN